MGGGLAVDAGADEEQEIGLGDAPGVRVFAEPPDLGVLLGAEVYGVEVDLIAADHFLELFGISGRFPLAVPPDALVLVVKPVDGSVDDALDDAVGAAGDVELADGLEERPLDILPALVLVLVPALLAV